MSPRRSQKKKKQCCNTKYNTKKQRGSFCCGLSQILWTANSDGK